MKLFFCSLLCALASGNLRTKPITAQSIILEACKEAGQQNKSAFIIFHASWCIWCHKMDSSMNDASCRKYFEDYYVIKHITVFETGEMIKNNNPGGEEFLAAHHASDQGIPAWFIFDKDGNIIADSQKRSAGTNLDTEGQNVGCPANEQEVNYFIDVLKKTSSLSNEEEQAIRKRFLKNQEVTH